MAYGTKYRHTFCNRYDIPCIVDILEEDYVGSIIEVEAGPEPIIITYESQDDFKFSERRGSSATVTLIGATQFELTDLWTSDERKFRVELTVDGALNWRGYVVPNGFRQDFTGGKYYAQIIASDGLSTLDGMRFVIEEGNPTVEPQIPDTNYLGRMTFLTVLVEILRKLELEIDIWTAIDIYDIGMANGPDDDPLTQCTVDPKTYLADSSRDDVPYWEDAGVAFDCGVVLDNLCRIFAAKIYQSGGAFKLKRVNGDENDTPVRYWRKYNSLGVFLESEPVDENVLIPCNGPDPVLLDGASLAMDRVFKQTKVNYKFTYLRDGDSPINLFKNGNFAVPFNWGTNNPPNSWYQRIDAGRLEIERINGLSNPEGLPGNIQSGLRVTGPDPPRARMSLSQDIPGMNNGDNMTFRWWQYIRRGPQTPSMPFNYILLPLYEIILNPPSLDYYSLVNDGLEGNKIKTRWVKNDTDWPLLVGPGARSLPGDFGFDKWVQLELDVPPMPDSGSLVVSIRGIGVNWPELTNTGLKAFLPSGQLPEQGDSVTYTKQNVYITGGGYGNISVTGYFIGLIKNVSSEEVPDTRAYYGINEGGFYTDQMEPFEILNGDVIDINHVSTIFRTNSSVVPNRWAPIDGRYPVSSIGLILAKSIQDQYGKPSRIIEGAIKSENLEFGSRVEFDNDPNIDSIRFIFQRGSFDIKENIFTGMLVELSASDVPPGGTDGGNNIEPNWQPTGAIRCIKDGGGLNTGQTEYQEIDINPASPTAGQTRWQPGNQDTTMCPIGEPNHYYWGSQPTIYDTDEFLFYPFAEGSEAGYLRTITVNNYSNPGGLYLYFLHRDNLGLITRIEGAYQGDTISDWQYLADTIIDGFTYRVMRMNYVTGVYDSLQMTFFFQ